MARKPKLVVANDLLLLKRKLEKLDMKIQQQLQQVLVLRNMALKK